jgi:hypothetical protein
MWGRSVPHCPSNSGSGRHPPVGRDFSCLYDSSRRTKNTVRGWAALPIGDACHHRLPFSSRPPLAFIRARLRFGGRYCSVRSNMDGEIGGRGLVHSRVARPAPHPAGRQWSKPDWQSLAPPPAWSAAPHGRGIDCSSHDSRDDAHQLHRAPELAESAIRKLGRATKQTQTTRPTVSTRCARRRWLKCMRTQGDGPSGWTAR